MTTDETDGTPLVDLSSGEYKAYLDRHARRLMGMGADAFRQAYEVGEFDDSSPAVSELVALLRIGQRHPIAA